MKTAVRLDDITPDMDWNKFHKIKKILDTCQIKPLIGVVPFNEDPNLARNPRCEDFAGFLKELEKEGWVIALHGYKHMYATHRGGLFPLNDFSEYAGLPYEAQLSMITEGKAALEKMGIFTDMFMAPAHSFDKNTLKALKACGFSGVTDGFGRTPYYRAGLVFYPIAFRRSDCFSEKTGYTTLVIHSNSIQEQEFEDYEKLFLEHEKNFISYGEYRRTEAEKRGFIGNFSEYLLAKLKFILVRIRA